MNRQLTATWKRIPNVKPLGSQEDTFSVLRLAGSEYTDSMPMMEDKMSLGFLTSHREGESKNLLKITLMRNNEIPSDKVLLAF